MFDDVPLSRHRVWTAAEVRRAIGRSGFERLVREGQLAPVRRGVYRGVAPPGEEAEWWQGAAALVVGRCDVVLAGPAAASAWGMDGFDRTGRPSTLSVRANGSRAASGSRGRRLDPPHLVHGVPVLSPKDTLLGLGAHLSHRRATERAVHWLEPADQVELALESALRHRLVTVDGLADAVDTTGNRKRGRTVLRRVLARRPSGVAPTESYLETRCVQVLRNGGLPHFHRQVGMDGGAIRVDFLRGGLVVEVDGREVHEARFVEDRRRWNRIQALGFHVLVFTWDDVEHHPAQVVRRVSDLLLRTGQRPT